MQHPPPGSGGHGVTWYHYLFSSALCLEATLFPDVKASCWPDCTLSPNFGIQVSGVAIKPAQPAKLGAFQWLTHGSTPGRRRQDRGRTSLRGPCLVRTGLLQGSGHSRVSWTQAMRSWRLIRPATIMTWLNQSSVPHLQPSCHGDGLVHLISCKAYGTAI